MATVTLCHPEGVHDTAGRYAHAVLIEGPQRRLVVSGQVGTRPDGSVAAGAEAQMDQALANLSAVLASQGFGPKDVVKMTVFLTDPAQIGPWRAKRLAWLDGHVSASTLLIVAGLATPDFLMEVEAEAVQ
jgi:2-iminobutanoate/2-iminopropanoate deaminase